MLELDLNRLYKPDTHHLGTLFAGLSGSGKTTAVMSTLQQAMKSKSFGEKHRFIIIDPKTQPGDYDLLGKPLTSIEAALRSIRKERFTLYWPSIDYLEEDVSAIIDYVFDLADSDEESSYTFILDEAATLITPSRVPLSLKRLSIQGRSKRIMPIMVSQRPLLNRWIEANLSNMMLFRVLPLDADHLGKRWGLDFLGIDEQLKLKPYSFMWFDLEKGDLHAMNPLPLPKPPKEKKESTDGLNLSFF